MQETTRTRIEAEVVRRLLQHLDERKDVQNTDLMNVVGFCRSCVAKWHVAAAENQGAGIELHEVREIIYGMPRTESKRLCQKEATSEQLQAVAASGQGHGKSNA